MNYSQTFKPVKLNLDKTPKAILPNESSYLLNHEVNNKSALGKATPMGANFLACDMQLPAGENYSVGQYNATLVNEVYSWHYNENGVHHIQRINADGVCEVVYHGDCLPLSPDPKHEIRQFRALLDVDYFCNKVPTGSLKRLIWTDGLNPIGSLDVESAIGTNFFTTPFFDVCPDPCALLQLCVPEPEGCITGEFVPFANADRLLSNKLVDRAFKFAVRHVYYDQRASELSDWSTLYYQDSKGCFDTLEGFSRCMKFRLPMGNPMVDVVEFYFSEDGGATWYLSDSIEKYEKYNSRQQFWYERSLRDEISSTFNQEDCTFEYIFCNDKQRIPIDPKLLQRVLNPLPRKAQCLFRIKESVAVANYELGNCTIERDEIDKFQVNMDCPATDCIQETAKVTVRAIIYNDTENFGSVIFRSGGAPGQADDLTDVAYFGLGNKAFEQNFTGDTRNFIAYIEGTDYWGEMKQWKSEPNFTNTQLVGVLAGINSDESKQELIGSIGLLGNFYYQEYTFTVPKGMKGSIRLVNHSKTNGLLINQSTSTQVVGMLPINGLDTYTGETILVLNENIKEMEFDTCNGDVDNHDAFVISDMVTPDFDPVIDSAYSGYITDNTDQPVEGLKIFANDTFKGTTDFNGYYFFFDLEDTQSVSVRGEQSCVGDWTEVLSFGIQSSATQLAHSDHEIDLPSYNVAFFISEDVVVLDCNGLPVRGVRVAMSGNKYKVTDVNGIAHFKLRNYETRDRVIRAVVMDANNCFPLDCNDGCNPCMPVVSDTLPACFEVPIIRTITQTTLLNTKAVAHHRGLKLGGRYPFGFIVDFGCGKLSAVNELEYINIPRLQEKGSLSYCNFTYNANGINIPGAKSIKIVRGVNLNPYYLQWAVTSFERTADGKIKLNIQSLNDYNALYNFKTNTVYKFLQGDRVEFIRNGDGNIFDSNTFGILNFQILSPSNDQVLSGVTDDVNYFNQLVIKDDVNLATLTEGAIIEIQSSTASTQAVTYYAICATIPVDANGNVPIQIGSFETFDTFLVNRQIGSLPVLSFEHKSPSDFWGETVINGLSYFVSDIGKAYFVNPYETERRYERNMTINSPVQINYFGDFVKTLDAQQQGYITAVVVHDDKLGLAICQNDNFLFQISDNFLILGADGLIRAAPADSIISNPDVKVRGAYGCCYEDIGSILFGDGFAFYLDEKNNAAIIHDFNIAQKAGFAINQFNTPESTCDSFFTKRMRDKDNTNVAGVNFLDYLRYSVGQNKANGIVYLTTKALRHPGINNAKKVFSLPNDTIMYNPVLDCFLGFASFTPEGYAELDLKTDGGCAFLTYQNSLPYIHPVIPQKWNNFYGVPCDWVIGITLNQFIEKMKIPLSWEMQSDKMFFVTNVETDTPTFISEIPPKRVKQSNGKWNAAFLNNVNSRGGLFNGARARGYFVDSVFVRDNTNNLQYNSIDNTKREQYSEVDSIFIKFMLSEQSGFTENL